MPASAGHGKDALHDTGQALDHVRASPRPAPEFRGEDLSATERLTPAARRLADEPVVRRARAVLVDELLATPYVVAAGISRPRVEEYVAGVAYVKALSELSNRSPRPTMLRSPYPVGRAGLDNPDNVYRFIRLDPKASYVITSRRNSSYNVYFQLLSGQPGEENSLHETLGFLTGDDLDADRRGRFRVTLDRRPASMVDGPHLQLPGDGTVLVVRDTLNDWATEAPARMSIRQVSRGRQDLATGDAADEVARRTTDAVRFWNAYTSQLQRIGANTVLAPKSSVGGMPGQVSSFGRFALRTDQALVLTVEPADAEYLGIQLGDNLFASLNYWDRTSSRNLTQTHRNADGTITYVISASDPGVANWIDNGGDVEGLVFLRWQGLAVGEVPAPVDVRIMDVSDVATDLPDQRISQAERRDELKQRRAAFDRRGMGTTRY